MILCAAHCHMGLRSEISEKGVYSCIRVKSDRWHCTDTLRKKFFPFDLRVEIPLSGKDIEVANKAVKRC